MKNLVDPSQEVSRFFRKYPNYRQIEWDGDQIKVHGETSIIIAEKQKDLVNDLNELAETFGSLNLRPKTWFR